MSYVGKYKKYELWVVFLLYVFALKIISAQSNVHSDKNLTLHNNECNCIHYDCWCCGHIELDEIKLNATICTFASYLSKDYGISFGLTYNRISIINETISARNPPPICIGEDIIEDLAIDLCIRLYDIEITKTCFHGCVELDGKLARLNILPVKLGCFGHKTSSSISLWSHALFTKRLYFFIFSIVFSNIIFYQ